MTPCGLAVEYSILKKYTAAIFKAEDGDLTLPQNVDIDISDYVCLL